MSFDRKGRGKPVLSMRKIHELSMLRGQQPALTEKAESSTKTERGETMHTGPGSEGVP
ncbi:hypothetical protein HMPREF1986_02498 [Oribacterium sp. oral taxon 078 str. F0263]|nr:hypothetical protein HMPREF1986_02498 [Oribacterium sp. oral taxon 078 str. F0263]